MIHDLATGQTEELEQAVSKEFAWIPDGIYFLNMRDDGTLYYWDGESVQKLDDTNAYALYCDESYCWVDSLDGLYRLNHDGSNKTKVECPGFVCCLTAGSAMYMIDYETETLYCVDKDTLAWERITR